MMRGKYTRLLTILVAFSMILSMHVTFAVSGGGNLELDDPYIELAKFEWKGNSWDAEGSSGGVTVTGSAIDVEFDSDEPIYAVVIKGGTDNEVLYFNGVYSGSFDNSDLENPGGEPDLSNITFYTMYVGEITIEKIVENEEGILLDSDETDFKFMVEMKVDGEWEEIDDSPVIITGNDTETLSELLLGEYKITEIEIDSDYTLDSTNAVEVKLINNGDSEDISFTNIMNEVIIDLGELVISKTLLDFTEVEVTDDDTEFEFMIEFNNDSNWEEIDDSPVYLEGGESETILDLPLGEYRVTEVDPATGYNIIGSSTQFAVLEENGDSEDISFTNIMDEVIPDLGELVISKTLLDFTEEEVTDDDTEFEFMIEMMVEENEVITWVEIDDSPVYLEGGESVTISDLALGEYRVTEENLPTGYSIVGLDVKSAILDVDGDIVDIPFTNMLDEDEPVVDDDDPVVDDDDPVASDDDDDTERRVIRVTDDDAVTVVESETITPEPTPQAPPVVVIEQQPEPEPEPEVEVVEEVTPQATLPATGASDPTVFAGFGAAFMALGLYLKKKRF